MKVSKSVMKKASLLLATVIVGLSTVNVNALDDANTATNTSNTNSGITVERISGVNRYDTSTNIYHYMRETLGGNYKILVTSSGDSYPDALSAGLLASEYNTPLVFVSKNRIPDETKDILLHSMSYKTLLVGGEASVSNDVFSKLYEATRISGKDRVDTAENVAMNIRNHRYEIDGKAYMYEDQFCFYNGNNFADALTATPFMYQYNKGKNPMTSMFPYMKGDVDYTGLCDIAFGGLNSIPDLKEKSRLAGSDRYKTAVEVAKAYKTMLKMDIDTVVITSGEKYQDALAATPLASSYNGAILLTQSGKLNDDTKEYIRSNPNIKHIIIVGGEGSVSSNVENELRNIRAN